MNVSVRPRIAGSGGTTKGATGGGEAKNTLRSKSLARMLLALGEGELALVDAEKSIFFDDVPLEADDGTANFSGVTWAFNGGLADQDVLPGFSAIESVATYGQEVKKHIPVTKEITNPLATAARVTIRIPALCRQKKSTSRLEGNKVAFRIEARPYGGAWTDLFGDVLVSGKCTSPYDRDYRFTLPTNTSGVSYPWEIRVTRLTNDADDSNDNGVPDENEDDTDATNQNQTYLQAITEIVEYRLSYPWTALFGCVFDAKGFGTNIPTISLEVKRTDGLVPSNLDPETRTYTGIWDGTFKAAANDNPAWALYDLMRSKRFGLGRELDEAGLDAIKWDLYEIGRYCDESVPDGFGGTEPRATFNGVIESQKEAYDLLALVASAFRGMTYWSSGAVRAVCDMPADPVILVTPANVVDGNFEYQGTAKKARHTVFRVTWNDPDDHYRDAVEVVEDADGIARYGRRTKDIAAVGCTSRGQARRIGLWAAETELRETQILTYRAGFDHAYLSSSHPGVVPGDIIAVQDPSIAGVDWSGRLLAATTTTVTLDREVTIESGKTWRLSVMLPSGTLATIGVTNAAGATAGLTLDGSLPETPAVGAIWVLQSAALEPKQWRVVSVAEPEPHLKEIKALEHDPDKFARIDQGVSLTKRQYTRLEAGIGRPTNVAAVEYRFVEAGNTNSHLLFSWSAPETGVAHHYVATLATPNGNVDLGSLFTSSVDISDVVAGTYELSVVAVTVTGVPSDAATHSIDAVGWSGSAAPTVTDLALVGGVSATVFATRNVEISWVNTVASSGSSGDPLYKENVVTVTDTTDGTVLRTQTVRGERWTYTWESNDVDAKAKSKVGAVRNLTFSVVCRDVLGRESDPARLSVTNPVPALVYPTFSPTLDGISVSIPTPAETDFAGMIVWVSETSGFNPTTTDPAYKGPNTSTEIALDAGLVYRLRVAAYDVFGTSGLAISAEQAVSASSAIDIDRLAPDLVEQVDTLVGGVEEVRDGLFRSLDEVQSTLFREIAGRLADRKRASQIGASVRTEVIQRYDAVTGALASRIDTVEAGIGETNASVVTEATARASADGALGSRIDTVQAQTTAAAAAVMSETTARADADSALGSRIDTVQAQTDTNAAAITTEATTRANADSAQASQITSLGSRMTTAESAITTEATTRAAAITTEATTRANADSAQASQITALGSRMTTAEGNITTNATGLSGLTTRVTTAEGKITATTDQVTELDAAVGTASANGSVQFSAAASQSGALARYELKVRTALDGAGSVVSQAAMIIEALSSGDYNIAQVKFRADRFYITDASGVTTAFAVVGGKLFADDLQLRHQLIIGTGGYGGSILIRD
jgi:predicted phage tail protein